MGITSAGKTESPEPLIHRLDELERRVSRLEEKGTDAFLLRQPLENAPVPFSFSLKVRATA